MCSQQTYVTVIFLRPGVTYLQHVISGNKSRINLPGSVYVWKQKTVSLYCGHFSSPYNIHSRARFRGQEKGCLMWVHLCWTRKHSNGQNRTSIFAVAVLSRYSDVIMSAVASQITGVSIDCSALCSGTAKCQGLRHWPLCGELPAQRGSNAENDSIWWRHHDAVTCYIKCDEGYRWRLWLYNWTKWRYLKVCGWNACEFTCVGPFHYWFPTKNYNLMEIAFHTHSNANRLITTKFGDWVVRACAIMCSDLITVYSIDIHRIHLQIKLHNTITHTCKSVVIYGESTTSPKIEGR